MLVIVEGPDGTGKSTLVQALKDYAVEYDVVVRHARPPKSHALDEYVLPLLGYRPWTPYHPRDLVICDRWHLGEMVYPTVLDRPTQMDANSFRYVELFLASRGAIVVHLTDDVNSLEDVLRQRGDDLIVPEQAHMMVDLFWRAVDASRLPTLHLPARKSDHDTLDEILDLASYAEEQAAKLVPYTTYVGPGAPKYLLVGDVRGGDPAGHGLKPAFLPYPNSCGEYLLRALLSTHRDDEFGIVNANDVDELRTLWLRLGRPRVVALGRLSQQTVTRTMSDVAADYAPHPQWWKRFRHADYEEYGKVITESWKP